MDGARPVVTEAADRLSRELVEAEDLDALGRTLLTGLTGSGSLPCVHGAALALVEGAGRRLRYLSSDCDLGGAGRRPAWTHIDAYEDVPLTRVVRTRESVVGEVEQLAARFPDFCRERTAGGTVCLAVLPLEPVADRREADPAHPVAPGLPLGAMVLFYDSDPGFDREQRLHLAALAREVSHALRQLTAGGGGPHAPAPREPLPDGAARAATVLPPDERAPSTARHFLRERLLSWGVPEEVAATAELCLSELVTNAVIHASSSSHLLVALIEGMLEVSVRDHGGPSSTHERVAPLRGEGGDLRVHGRGLMLVDTLTSDWGADTLPDGTSVWFTLALEDAG